MTASAEPVAGREWVSVPPNAFYLPSPVTLLTTVDDDGEVDASTMSAMGAVCLQPAIIAVGVKPRRRSMRNIRRRGAFVVNLPLEDDLWAADFVGTRSLKNQPDKIRESGLTIGRMPRTGLPYVTSCPVAMACEPVAYLGRTELGLDVPPSHQVVVARLTECLVDKAWLGDDEVRLEEMPLLVYLNRVYTRRGSTLNIQRFTDDAAKRDAKMREYRSLGDEV